MNYENGIQKLQELIRTMSQPGNWDADAYNHGMINGMILAECVLTNQEAKFFSKPSEYGENKEKRTITDKKMD